MLSHVVALIISYFAYAEARRRCFARHALIAALVPFAMSFTFVALRYLNIHISFELMLGFVSLEIAGLLAAIAGLFISKRVADRFAPAYDAYFAAL